MFPLRSLFALVLSAGALHAALTTTIESDPWPNVAPFAATRSFDVERNTARRTPSAILNVYDVENDALSVQSFTQPAHGSATHNGDGTFTYTPAAGYAGADSFTVTVSDGHGGTSVTTMNARVIVPAAGYAATRFVNMADVQAGGATIDFGASVSTVPRVVDWNRDGLLDFIVGSGGAVWLYLNTGTASAPVFAAATRVQAAGVDITAGTGRVCVAWADFNGDAVPDLAVANTSNSKVTYYRTTTTTGSIALAAGVVLRNATNTADFTAADSRVDVADWNGDGKPDVITGASSGNVRVAYNNSTGATPTISAPVTALDSTGLTISGSYNATPRVIDLSRDGVADLIVAWNWGNIDFRANTGTAAAPVLGASGEFGVSLPDGSAPDLHALTDGAFTDLADFNGDGVLDLLFGGHIGGRVRLATGVAANSDLAGLTSTVAAHPADLGTFLQGDATAKALMQQRLGSVYDFITTLATPSQVDAMTNALEALITGHPQYFKAETINVTTHPRIPSLAAMLHLTMLKAKYHDPAHRTRTADAAVMTGAYRKLCEDIGLLYMENFLNPNGAEAIWQWVRFIPRDIYPGTGITQQESLDSRDYLVRGHLKNTFSGSGTSGGEFGFSTDARPVIGDRGSENFLMTVVHHEAAHDFDAYVNNNLPADFRRRWGQILVRACGRDASGVNFIKEDPGTGWYSQSLTQAHWQAQGWWNGTDTWSTTLTDFFTTGLGASWNSFGFMRGNSGTFFLTTTQESLATQGNQFWNSTEGRIQVALDRWARGYDTNITEVLHYLDIQSKGANKVKFWENTNANDQRISFAKLYRNAQGYIDGIDVNGRAYRFVVDATGVVTAALPPKVNVTKPQRTQCSIPAGVGLWLEANATPQNATAIASIGWSLVSGPGTAAFDHTNTGSTGVTFSTAGDYVLRCTASDGQFTGTADVRVRVGALHTPAWSTAGVGEPGEADGYTLAGGSYTIKATGSGISTGTSDKFLFISREFVGDAEVSARIVSVQNVNGSSSRTGVMLRSTTASDAKHAFAEVGSTLSGAFIRRSATAAAGTSTSFTASAFPCWVRVRRIGTSVSAWRAADSGGAPGTWTQIGSTQTIDLGGAIEAGIAATSGSTYNPATIVVDNVTFSTAAANFAPQPGAGADQTIATLTANLAGSAGDDSLPANAVTTEWQTRSGAAATFGNSAAPSTTATFSGLGASTLRLFADDTLVRTFDDIVIARVTPNALWRQTHFTSAELADPAVSGPDADPEHDGLCNLLEYLLGFDPRAQSSAGAALVHDFAQIGADKYLRVSIVKSPGASDATCVAEASGNLATWLTGETVVETNTSTLFIARDTVPVASGGQRFIRLRLNTTGS